MAIVLRLRTRMGWEILAWDMEKGLAISTVAHRVPLCERCQLFGLVEFEAMSTFSPRNVHSVKVFLEGFQNEGLHHEAIEEAEILSSRRHRHHGIPQL